ncbi:MAG: DUF4132 domain-containing protein [Sedimentitalea sp.]
MKSFLNKLLPGADPTAKAIKADLKRLNETQAGMGDAAADYVLKGAPETVLSTLSVHGGAQKLWIARMHYPGARKPGEPPARAGVFLDMKPFDPALLARYAAVLAAGCASEPAEIVGSKTTPLAMRIAFSEAFLGAFGDNSMWSGTPRSNPAVGLTASTILDLTQALGGTVAQLFELLYWDTNEYTKVKPAAFRSLIGMQALIDANPQAAVQGAAKTTAPGRAVFVDELRKSGRVHKAPFFNFVLDCCGDGSRAVREASVLAIKDVAADQIEDQAIQRLAKGTVGVRAAMVEILGALGSETAQVALKAHAKTEKTARIVAAIDTVFAARQVSAASAASPDGATHYTAIDGTQVDIPPLRAMPDAPAVEVSPADRKVIKAAWEAKNEQIKTHNKENKTQKYHYERPLINRSVLQEIEALMAWDQPAPPSVYGAVDFLQGSLSDWTKQHLAKMGVKQQVFVALKSLHQPASWMSGYFQTEFDACLQAYLASEQADLRALDRLWQEKRIKASLGGWGNPKVRIGRAGDILRTLIPAETYMAPDLDDLSDAPLWPYLAENFDILDHALGIVKNDDIELSRTGAISCLARLPKTPMRYFAVLLEVATGERKAGKAEAREMLADVPDVLDRLVILLGDSRQAIRAGAAQWLGTRGEIGAIKALKAQLKKEKSELARAAILTSLQQLNEPLDDYVGPAALLREAETGLKKAKFDKLEWLGLDTVPAAKFKTGKAVPQDVLRWWVFLGFKLKQPGGNALFDIYLDQLAPDSAAAFSAWILDSWIAFDTETVTDAEANAHAEAGADQRQQLYLRWDPNFTRAQAYADLRREIKGVYHNSGAATKGILGFATRASDHATADKIRAYLRNHGARTSQASSLLEVLARKGDPVSLQVVISAATRLRQKGVQAFAGELVQAVADKMNWSLDELGDRTIPSAGLDDDGVLELPCGLDQKLYRATLGDDLTFVLTNPDGKTVKALSSGADDVTKAAKKQLSASKKELKQVVSMQAARLYEALCAERIWAREDWERDLRDHPIMRRLSERAVWQGLDANGQVTATFRPTAEGDYIDVEDGDVALDFDQIRLAHGAMMERDLADAWHQHLKDYEVAPLFAQFGRTLLRLGDDQKDHTHIMDREGWVTDSLAIRGAASKHGYDRGQPQDGGWFFEYRKTFKSAGLTAIVDFTGNFVPEENIKAALITLSFIKDSKRRREPVKLSDVPPVLLSECWNDFHVMAAKGAFDPDWKKSTQW